MKRVLHIPERGTETNDEQWSCRSRLSLGSLAGDQTTGCAYPLRIELVQRAPGNAVQPDRAEENEPASGESPPAVATRCPRISSPGSGHLALSPGFHAAILVRLTVANVYYNVQSQLVVHVLNGKGGKEREVPALPGHEQDVLTLTADRKPEERVFDRIPKHMDVHAYRREYAQALYLSLADCNLPSPGRRLRQSDYDLSAVQRVSWALGHNRLDVVLRHYLL